MIAPRLNPAFGAPGIVPRWTSGAKEVIGTAYSVASKVWFTAVRGCLTEIYYPTIDTPQVRDLQFLLTDGKTFFHEERRALTAKVYPLENGALGFAATMSDPEGRYQLRKQVITDPFQNALLMHTTIDADPEFLRTLRVYVLCAPHLNIGGYGNNAEIVHAQRNVVLTAFRDDTHLALKCSLPFSRASVGYVGTSDGWQDLHDDMQMDWQFDNALDGNVAMMGEIDIRTDTTFTIGIGFGTSRQSAVATLLQSLTVPFEATRKIFVDQWMRTAKRFTQSMGESAHDPHLFEKSVNLILGHEDKTYPGALIASMSIPWGEIKGDEEIGGYHLVWARDMCQSATALLSVGDLATPLRSLIYLAVTQLEDGCFYQNFWIDGRPYWRGVQLDEVAFPVILAWRLKRANALSHFNPLPMTISAIGFLLRNGPTTRQDRWEEASGYSPSTLAAVIGALICGAEFIREAGDEETAQFVEEYADFLNAFIERWTVTTEGTLHLTEKRHFIRVNPSPIGVDGYSDEDPNSGTLTLANQKPGDRSEYPAKEIVDAGFLEFVRYGIRRGGEDIFERSLRVIDQELRVEMPQGPCWKRYNHDGYGQRDDGSGFNGWGVGRPWPLLTGERAHYELAAGRDVLPLLRTYEAFASGTGLFPEQLWDCLWCPNPKFHFGGPTGAANPLVWAHAEYIKLVGSLLLGYPVDRIEPVYERYAAKQAPEHKIEVWCANRRCRTLTKGKTLRFIFHEDFTVRWSDDDWQSGAEVDATRNALDVHYADVTPSEDSSVLHFTLFWKAENRWEERDYSVTLED